MKINLTLLLFLLVTKIIFAQEKIVGINFPDHISSYKINLKLDTVKKHIEVSNTVSFSVKGPSSEIRFLFLNTIKPDSIKNAGESSVFEQSGDTLIVKKKIYRKSEMTFYYRLPVDSFRYDKIFLLTRGMKWCPYIHDNISELKAEVIAPAGYQVNSSANLTEIKKQDGLRYYEAENKINSGLVFIFVPKDYYMERENLVNGISLRFLFHNKDTLLQKNILTEASSAFDFGNNFIGNYKRKSLIYIEIPGFGAAQSLESIILMGSDFISYFKSYPDMRFWVSHETIHQWNGNGYFNSVYDNSGFGIFTEESLTEYLRFLFLEDKFGSDTLNATISENVNIYNREIKGTDQDIAIISNIPGRSAYCTGPLIFHKLRMNVGRAKFQEFIKYLYSKNYGRVINYKLFREYLMKFAKEKDVAEMEKDVKKKGLP